MDTDQHGIGNQEARSRPVWMATVSGSAPRHHSQRSHCWGRRGHRRGAIVTRDVPPRAIVTGPAAHVHRLVSSQSPAGSRRPGTGASSDLRASGMNERQSYGVEDDQARLLRPPSRLSERVSKGYAEEALCPLRFVMQQLASTTVSQSVFYAEGEYAPRPDLLEDLERWERLHRLIACRICPALRTGGNIASDLTQRLRCSPRHSFTASGRCWLVAPVAINRTPARSKVSRLAPLCFSLQSGVIRRAACCEATVTPMGGKSSALCLRL